MPTDSESGCYNKFLEDFNKSKAEIRTWIEASEARILLGIDSRIRELETENKFLKSKIEELDRRSRKNNLIVFGLPNNTGTEVGETCKQLNDLLGINLAERDISDSSFFGNPGRKILKIELQSFHRKRYILQNCNKLKGTKIVITHDLTKLQQSEGKILRKHLIKAKQTSGEKCFIKGDRLWVGDKAYTVKELEEFEEVSDEQTVETQHNSAPPTPARGKVITPKLDQQITPGERDLTNKQGSEEQQLVTSRKTIGKNLNGTPQSNSAADLKQSAKPHFSMKTRNKSVNK